ncbi:hypothetical protein [Dethiobacter alkaliphilus]|uniref:hypothetical protein n=1 Tax=Dethiobacter alkaliphilus TaxID=427926 RepID=UPI0022274623|nr:hypothetical protein [Dethiobacter alkaliphilus]MCW3489696.1 hypothetical protein [Dethiobacter alkaliphilus]
MYKEVNMFAWMSQRITGIFLMFLIPWKIYSGYALTGQVPRIEGLLSSHIVATLDGLLIVTVIFHIAYGLRVMLIDAGIKQEKVLFNVATALSLLLSVYALYYIYWR